MAIDWRQGMSRTYEMVRVTDEWSEAEAVQDLSRCSVTYEREGLRCSLSAEVYERLEDGYYRVYMVAEQGAEAERVPLATVRVQSARRSTDGKAWRYSVTGYSPLVELDSDYPPVGWSAQGLVVQRAAEIVAEHCKAPCSYPASAATMDAWTADDGDTWLDCLEAVLSKAAMHVEVDGNGTVLFVHDFNAATLNPVWTFDDAAYGLPSILMPDVDEDTDFYDLKNKVEVVYSEAGVCYVGSAVNDDERSRASTARRGYVSALRDTSPEIDEPVTEGKVQAYAEKLLSEQGAATNTVDFSHAFVPTAKVGRCVRLDYTRMGYRVDAVVRKQTLECDAAGVVSSVIDYEEAVYDG